ncbi:hypothetical protein [Nitrosarchaeum sp. AC2]|uniref:hypothetical protein n=1 Tax=Nitrosarchaeum sp. AC2 TaxID=2259673 RepID=UPI0015CCA2EC|nr:hypothetical protein [Nitrosarchaeum sp. AC2]
MTLHINHNQKMKWGPLIMRRDYPGLKFAECTCFYCKQPFHEDSKDLCLEWDHLNDNDGDNRLENMVWAHAICNEDKKTNFDWKNLAQDKLKENERWADKFDPEREQERGIRFNEGKQTSNEADVSVVIIKHCKQFLSQQLLPHSGNPPKRIEIPMKEAVECVTYLVQEEIGRGSHSAVQRHLESMSCSVAKDYERREVNGKQIIFRRTGQ